jgi:DNA-directed RNA polymerase subunit RPC12/RpoP
LIQTTYEEFEEIRSELSKAKEEAARANARFRSWDSGLLLKKLFKSSYGARKAEAEIAIARTVELEEQLRLTTIATQIELASGQAEPFFKMRDDFTALTECAAIWDIKTEQKTDKIRERTRADTAISRERVTLSLGTCELIGWDQEVPHLRNANGGDMFLYPGFILYRASRTAFSVIDCHDVKLLAAAVKFHEQEGVPNDATTIGRTWAKTNKDGSPDRRFANNYEIPIVRYGQAEFRSETGLWEEFHFSNSDRLDRFSKSWNAFVGSFEHRISLVAAQNDFPQEPKPTASEQKSAKLVGTDVHFECSACRQPIEVNAEAVGQEFRCPGCGAKLSVPEVT